LGLFTQIFGGIFILLGFMGIRPFIILRYVESFYEIPEKYEKPIRKLLAKVFKLVIIGAFLLIVGGIVKGV